jgi:hypothetical protein
VPRWASYGATVLFASVLCLTINFRAFTELTAEVEENEDLNAQIESITTENLNLQEEIYYLENDSDVIERGDPGGHGADVRRTADHNPQE